MPAWGLGYLQCSLWQEAAVGEQRCASLAERRDPVQYRRYAVTRRQGQRAARDSLSHHAGS